MPAGEEETAVKFYGYLLGLEQISKPPELAPRGGVWFRGRDLELHLGIGRASCRERVFRTV